MPRMVTKTSGSQPQNTGTRRHPPANENPPNVVDQRSAASHMDPSQARPGAPRRTGSSSVERSSAGGASGTSRTLPTTALQHGRSSKGSQSKASGGQSQSLPGHTSARVPAEGSRRPHREASHRANPHGLPAPTQPTRGRSNVNITNVRVEVNQERPNPTRERRTAPTTPSARQSQSLPPGQGVGPTQVSQSQGAVSSDSRATQGSRKPSASSKETKERYLRQTQAKQAATLPPGGTSARAVVNRSRPGEVSANNVQTQSRTVTSSANNAPCQSRTVTSSTTSAPGQSRTVTSSATNALGQSRTVTSSANNAQPHSRTAPSSANNAANSNRTVSSTSSRPSGISGQQQTISSRESQGPSQSLPSQDQRRERSQDIARITVDARGVINRTPNGSNNQTLPQAGVSIAQQAQPVSHPTVFRTANRNLAPNPPSDRVNRDSQNIGNTTNNRTERRTVDPSNLRLDIVNLTQQDQGANVQPPPNTARIFTSNLNAGVSVNRPERPEINEALPDILNSHVLPPYTVRQNQHRPSRQNNHRSRASQNRSRRQIRNQPGVTQIDDEEKGCCTHEGCLSCLTVLTTFRWVLVSLALLGVLCVITGIILGALHMTVGSSYLTLSLMFIGLGVMLVIVVGVGWKCTPPGHEPCHLLFNLGEHCTRDVTSSSRRRHRERNHWYGGVSYPEFRYRRPPPSYNASMQEYQQQLMLAQLQMNNGQPNNNNPDNNGQDGLYPVDLPPSYVLDDNYSMPSSPPPSYKSRASTIRPGLHITFPPQGDDYPNSRPPTYRSRAGTGRRPALDLRGDESGGVDNPACSDTEPPSSSSTDSSRRQSDAATSESAGSSTLHRVDQVVGYLDNVLEGHDRTLEYHITPSSRAETQEVVRDGTKAGGSGTNPITGTEDAIRIRDTPL